MTNLSDECCPITKEGKQSIFLSVNRPQSISLVSTPEYLFVPLLLAQTQKIQIVLREENKMTTKKLQKPDSVFHIKDGFKC